MTRDESRSRIVRELSQQLRDLELHRQQPAGEAVSTGIPDLDRLLPDAGLRGGTLTEWLGEGEGSGAGTLVLMSISRMLQGGGAFVVVDETGEFYPPAADGLNIDLKRTIVVRPRCAADALWALEQALQCPGVAASLCWVEQAGDRVFRRLQLAVESGGGIGFLIRPASVRQRPSWAEVRLLVRSLPSRSPSSGRRLRLELLRCRGGFQEGAIELELSHETGHVHSVPRLACAAPAIREAGA